MIEYDQNATPKPIEFDISDCYSGQPEKKLVKIRSESAPKEYILKIDLNTNTKSFETKLQKFFRGIKQKNEKPIKLTDYTRGALDNFGV